MRASQFFSLEHMRTKVKAPAGRPLPVGLVAAIVAGLLAAWWFSRSASGPTGRVMPAQSPAQMANIPVSLGEELALGEKLSQQVCASCHLRPEPDVLDRVTWAMEVLPAMAEWLGMNPGGTNGLDLDPRVREMRLLPEAPVMSIEEWRAICTYYLAKAPDRLELATNAPAIQIGLKHFKVQPLPHRLGASATMVRIDTESSHIYYGESRSNALVVLDGSGEVEMEVNFSSPPVDLQFEGNDLYLALMGSYGPSDELNAKIMRLGNPYRGQRGMHDVLTGLARSTGVLRADINRDGRMDLVHCGYGNLLGKFSWYEAKADGTYVEQVIIDRSGAGSARVQDLNGDGWPDLVVGMAQAREGIYVCWNRQGQFEVEPVAEMHPAWGMATIELADVDGDGHLDILACNGDNGDHTGHVPPMRPYHGLRIYRNDGKGKFTEKYFMPINGCYKVMVADFDLDGDKDLAVISFYPDYRRSPRESFMYLENTGPWQYRPFSFDASFSGRWITMDVGDVDKDGDADIVLGAHNEGPTFVPSLLQKRWQEAGPTLIILRNTIRGAAK
jgi:hypothetical protein